MNEFVDVSSKGAIKDLVKEGDISIDVYKSFLLFRPE